MSFRRKIHFKGFTLIEIIITMIISSILLGLTFKLLFSMLKIDNQNSIGTSDTDKILFTYSLFDEISFNAAIIKKVTEDQIDFIDDMGKKTTLFFVPSTLIFRQDFTIDTIRIEWNNLTFSSVDSSTTLINMISFYIESGFISYPIVVQKEYPFKLLFKLQDE